MRGGIFISRKQTADSYFYKTLSANGFDVHGESLIEITPILFKEVPEVDWIFFYSKTGIRCFFENAKLSAPYPKLATIGASTADYLEENFGHPQFVGNGHPINTAESFLKIAKGEKVLFVRAKNSMQSVQQLLKNEIEATDLIVYENVPKTDFDLPDFDYLVFTSPLNVKAYFSQKKYREGQCLIAIGETTAAALRGMGLSEIVVSEMPSEKGLVDVVLNIQ